MAMELLNGSLKIDIFFEKNDKEYDDNICVCLKEYGPEDEKILYAGETNLFITADEARKLAEMLVKAAERSSQASR
ncbi:MAG: hypothetical protein MUO42_11850 [Anaerolineaceae bacterium]|jgi:hypothetical protein|nr:hypothetical protein [Anaerolineaceae bacterium]